MQQAPYPPPVPPPYGPRFPRGPSTRKPTWLNQNMGWVVSVGCLSMIMIGCLFLMSIFGVATSALKSSDAYAIALRTAEHDPSVIAELGAPLQAGFFVSGSVRVANGKGHADLSIPVSGSVRSGKLTAVANKAAGVWTFSKLNVTVNGRPGVLDLLPKLTAPVSSGKPALTSPH